MKQSTTLVFTGIFSCLTAFLPLGAMPAEGSKVSNQEITVIPLHELTSEHLEGIFLGRYPSLAVEFAAGSYLSIDFCLQGDLIRLVANNENIGSIEVLKTFYVRVDEKNCLFSVDKKEWKSLLEFVTGQLYFLLKPSSGSSSVTIDVRADQRS